MARGDDGKEILDGTEGIATMCRCMYNNLLCEGFSESEAMDLVKVWLAALASRRA